MAATGGLRERKKQQTRALIASTARRLFAERGFDAVTVVEIAREAEVSEKTVFNYFATKEDLLSSGVEVFEELLGAVRDRPPGESVVAALRRFLLVPPMALVGDVEVARIVTESPALRAREREVAERFTSQLAELIAAETRARPGDVAPRVVAAALTGLQRSLVDLVRREALAGRPADAIAREYRRQAKRGFALLEDGLGRLGARA